MIFDRYMKAISVHVPEKPYVELKAVASREGRPVAELIREAMTEYLARKRSTGRCLRDIPSHSSGRLRKGWTRTELLDEMRRQ